MSLYTPLAHLRNITPIPIVPTFYQLTLMCVHYRGRIVEPCCDCYIDSSDYLFKYVGKKVLLYVKNGTKCDNNCANIVMIRIKADGLSHQPYLLMFYHPSFCNPI